jgi:hypothetical protein
VELGVRGDVELGVRGDLDLGVLGVLHIVQYTAPERLVTADASRPSGSRSVRQKPREARA